MVLEWTFNDPATYFQWFGKGGGTYNNCVSGFLLETAMLFPGHVAAIASLPSASKTQWPQ